jgi:hypothetical protein
MSPTAEHERLGHFAGSWVGNGQTHPSPWANGSMAKSTWTARFDATGLFLLVDHAEAREDGSTFNAHAVMTIDPADAAVLWYVFDSFGYPPLAPARGTWSGSVLTLEKQTQRGQGRTILRPFNDSFEQQVLSKANGAPDFVPVSTMLFTRQSSEPKSA